ncbi:MAG: hypothetical protein NT075_36880 [Chloroflexi bacterium]|nr:hypothetical protein [Chloroflexota bacterium]
MSTSLLLFGTMWVCAGCTSGPAKEWTKFKKIAGSEQGLSHVSGLVVDDQFAYVTIGGTIADQEAGTSGLRKVALDSGTVTSLASDDTSPQSEIGGIAIDEKFVYWNAYGKILRIAKNGGKPEMVVDEHVGIAVDLVIDNENVYWANHGYYSSSNSADRLRPIYVVPKQGGKIEIFAQQDTPSALVADEKFLYWLTPNSIVKQAKLNGTPQVVYQAAVQENVDMLSQDAENLYFGFREAGKPRWSLRKVSKQGGEPQILVKTYSLKPVVADDTNIYFFDEEGSYKDALCKISKDGGEVTRLDSGYASGVIAQSPSQIYLASLDNIYSFTKH